MRSTSVTVDCTSIEPRMVLRLSIPFPAVSCEPCANSSASKNPFRPSSSPRSGERRSPRQASAKWSCGWASPQSSNSRCIRTCCGTLAGINWPTRASTPAPCRPISGTKTSITRCAIPSCRRRASKTSGRTEPVRTREYLTEREVEKLIEGCKGNRRPHRDQTMILLAFRHGLRASELCDLQWTQVDFNHATLAVTRVKHGTPSTHPLTGRELRALRRLHREAEGKSPFLFLSERGSPMTVSNFQKLINRACEAAGLKIKAHPHMLRHACGYKLANEGHDTRGLQAYLGHKNIQHTVRYTELAPTRFKGWWKD